MIYEFTRFRLDTSKKRLMRDENIILLTPKEFDVLLMLIENAGQIVEKEELLERVWKNTFVEEGTLTRNISWLRKKLAAHTEEDFRIIETVPKLGYRLLSSVTVIETPIKEKVSRKEESGDFVSVSVTENTAGENLTATKANAVSEATPNKYLSKFWILLALPPIILSGYLVYKSYSPKPPDILLASKIVPFSGLPGKETSPAFSLDGKQLVYSWDGGIEGGNSDIYIKLLGTGEPMRLTTNSANEINPVFSPDGKSIAFVRLLPTHNEIVLMSALGGSERKLYDQASYASISFSPDGKSLALANLDSANKEVGIFTLDLQSGAKTQLTAPPAPAVDHTPRFSPDGKSLAFIRYFSSFRREIFVVSATGGEARQITFDDTRIYGMAWGSDSRKLFFSSFRSLDQLNLWQISTSGGTEPQFIPTNSKSLQDVAIAPDGRTIAFVEETADENIWEIKPNTAAIPRIRSIRADHSPEFSPDGSQIVFASERTGNYEVWLTNVDGSNQRRLTVSQGSAGSPRFSPDGKFIAYDLQSAGKSDVYVISVNGGNPRRLTSDDKNNFMPAWSADGQTIFFISNRSGSEQMWKIPAAGGEAVQITKQGAFEICASTDGKTLIYSKGGGKSGLWQIDSDGNNEKPIHELAEVGGWRSWTLAGNKVFYTAPNTQPPYQMKSFDLVARQTNVITSVEKPPLAYYSNLAATANGEKILYAQQDQNSDTIFLAEFGDAP